MQERICTIGFATAATVLLRASDEGATGARMALKPQTNSQQEMRVVSCMPHQHPPAYPTSENALRHASPRPAADPSGSVYTAVMQQPIASRC